VNSFFDSQLLHRQDSGEQPELKIYFPVKCVVAVVNGVII